MDALRVAHFFPRLCLLTLLIVGSASAALADKRVALVIGISAYDNASALRNPVRDAHAVAAALRAAGFAVRDYYDLPKAQFDAALKAFGDEASGADWALVYFAGHGIGVGNETYLLPRDATLARAEHIDFETIPLARVRAMAAGASALRLVLLDSCRNNPFAARMKGDGKRAVVPRGLERPSEPEGGELIAYATREHDVADDGEGEHSPFTAAFLAELQQPGLEVGFFFRGVRDAVRDATRRAQDPAVYSSLPARLFYFRPPMGGVPPQADAPTPRPGQQAAVTPPPPPPPPSPCDGVVVSVAAGQAKPCIKAGSGESFKDCASCPELVVAPAGSFLMGSPKNGGGHEASEEPQHKVTIATPLAVGKFAVTFAEWDACVADGGCGGYEPYDEGWGRGMRPVINVSWVDAQAYVGWLKKKTGKGYRLLTEAEREYVTRAGRATPFWWGGSISTDQANYDGGGSRGVNRQKTVPVSSFAPNPWGLYQVHGNILEWVEDCWDDSYLGATSDGSANASGDCRRHVLRGGSWNYGPQDLRSAYREGNSDIRSDYVGFRVARTLNP